MTRLKVGLNPYGISYTLGLLGKGTPRANPRAGGLEAYLRIAGEIGAAGVELPTSMLVPLGEAEQDRLRERLIAAGLFATISQGSPVSGIPDSIDWAQRLGARLIRVTLTPVLCGDRAEFGAKWKETIATGRKALGEAARRASEAGLFLSLENHQDLTSAEILEYCEAAGTNVGVCLDTGNPLAVGEAPVAFARAIAPRIQYLHLKDYRVQWTAVGYRLIRCALGEGVVPFTEIVDALSGSAGDAGGELLAAIEPGAHFARPVRLLTAKWWEGYPPRDAPSLADGLAAARKKVMSEDQEWRTPWERGAPGEEVGAYEMEELRSSVEYLRTKGWM